MYKNILRLGGNSVSKHPEHDRLCSLLPEPSSENRFKQPIDFSTNDFSTLQESKEAEVKNFEKLGNLSSAKTCLIQKSWFLEWKNYIHGGRFPGIIRTQGLVNALGRLTSAKPKNYIKLNFEQFNFLSSIYSSEPLVELPFSNSTLQKFRNHGILSGNANTLLSSDTERNEALVTLIDENFCKESEKKTKIEDRPELSLKFYKKKVVFENHVVFCYLNSVLQCFLSIPDVARYFFSISTPPESKIFTHQMYSIVDIIINNETKRIRPALLWKEVNRHFPASSQKDFFDCWKLLIRNLVKENKPEQVFEDIFQGKLTNKLKCRVCQKETEKIEDFFDISLEFSASLKKSFKLFFQTEKVKIYCDYCKEKTKHSKKPALSATPIVLVVQMKRFIDGQNLEKIEEFSEFHKVLKLDVGKVEEKYNLVALSEIKGGIDYGHYNVYCKRAKKWYKFNDDEICKVPLMKVLTKKLYCAIYEKQ